MFNVFLLKINNLSLSLSYCTLFFSLLILHRAWYLYDLNFSCTSQTDEGKFNTTILHWAVSSSSLPWCLCSSWCQESWPELKAWHQKQQCSLPQFVLARKYSWCSSACRTLHQMLSASDHKIFHWSSYVFLTYLE